jgi:hypothetical protein
MERDSMQLISQDGVERSEPNQVNTVSDSMRKASEVTQETCREEGLCGKANSVLFTETVDEDTEDGCRANDYQYDQAGDEELRLTLLLWRGLSDAEDVDEDTGDEFDRADHSFSRACCNTVLATVILSLI